MVVDLIPRCERWSEFLPLNQSGPRRYPPCAASHPNENTLQLTYCVCIAGRAHNFKSLEDTRQGMVNKFDDQLKRNEEMISELWKKEKDTAQKLDEQRDNLRALMQALETLKSDKVSNLHLFILYFVLVHQPDLISWQLIHKNHE